MTKFDITTATRGMKRVDAIAAVKRGFTTTAIRFGFAAATVAKHTAVRADTFVQEPSPLAV
jgi:hypothetical protein